MQLVINLKPVKMRILLLPYLLFGFTVVSCSQELPESNVPSIILNAFKTRFVDAKDIDWKKEGQLYEVEFERGVADEDHKILFDLSGAIVVYKHDITTKSLPAPVIKAIQAKYKDYKIDEVENLEKSGITYYQVELENKPKKQQLVFSADGAVNNEITYWD
jgi:uncharacterized membrane protein YkoI